MKPALLLPIAVALLLAGSVITWWRIPDDRAGPGRARAGNGLILSQTCSATAEHDCAFFDTESGAMSSERHWTFLVGLLAASLLIALRAAPVGSRLRANLASACVIASAGALMLGLAALCVMISIAIEVRFGMPGLGGPLFLAGAILGIRTARLYAVGEPPA